MRIRSALAACAAAAALLASQASFAGEDEAAALPTVNFTSVMEVSPYKPMSYALDYMADLVSKRTGGRFTITRRMSYGDLSSSDCLVKIVVNTEDITVVPIEVIGNFMPWVRVMSLPYIFTPRDYEGLAMDGAANRELCRTISDKETRIIALDTWYTDYLHLVMRDHPVERPEDLRGQNIWLPSAGPLSEYLASMGANPVIMPMNSAVDAIRRGVIDGMVTPLNSMASRNPAYEHMRFVSLFSLSRGGFVVLVSQQRFEALPPAYQRILREAALDAEARLNDFSEECARVVLGRLRRNPRIVLSSPDLTQFKSYADRIRLIYLKRYPQFAARLRNALYGQAGDQSR